MYERCAACVDCPRPPRRVLASRILAAGCYGALVTLEPTGLVLVRWGERLTLAELFRSWGVPLEAMALAGFVAPRGTDVRAFVDGRRWPGAVGAVPLRRHAEIVVEVGPSVAPHAAYRFPPGTGMSARSIGLSRNR